MQNVKSQNTSASVTQSSTPTESDKRPLGSLDIEVKEVNVVQPARSINRMWPNR